MFAETLQRECLIVTTLHFLLSWRTYGLLLKRFMEFGIHGIPTSHSKKVPKNWGFIFFISCPCFSLLLTIGISRKNICMYHAFTSACLSQQVAPNSPWRSKPLCSSSAQSSTDGLAAEECNFLRTPYNSIFGCSQKTRIEFLSYRTGFFGSFLSFFNLSHNNNWFYCLLQVLYCGTKDLGITKPSCRSQKVRLES